MQQASGPTGCGITAGLLLIKQRQLLLCPKCVSKGPSGVTAARAWWHYAVGARRGCGGPHRPPTRKRGGTSAARGGDATVFSGKGPATPTGTGLLQGNRAQPNVQRTHATDARRRDNVWRWRTGRWLVPIEAARRLGPLQPKACVRSRKQKQVDNTSADAACQQPMHPPPCQGEPQAQPLVGDDQTATMKCAAAMQLRPLPPQHTCNRLHHA